MSRGPQLFFETLKPQMTVEFAQMVHIYKEALPSNERKSVSQLRVMLEKPSYEFLIAKREEAVVGFSIALRFSHSYACLLEYMAVLSSRRGLGIGQQLFSAAANTKLRGCRYMLLEVDSDRGWSDPSNSRTVKALRKIFYRKLGCREVKGLSYLLPLVTSGTPSEMDLLVYKHDLPDEISKDQLREWLEQVYVEVYDRVADDARIDDMLGRLPSRVQLI